MSQTVISVDNVSKQYRLGLIGGRTLAGDLSRWWARVRHKPDPLLKIGQEHLANLEGEYIWALRDVGFEVKQGEVLGIIGRNGAGKSTLLKILSRVTAPTLGQVRLKGRIASLLEVGTGFHPELTGRENIYLNGAILGMNKREIAAKFDEIVAFAEIDNFIDTPVKRYSSGMYVRLAFAVAAHLEPEILLVDEVLAVGDAAFQNKCLGKMSDVAREGRTVLFVSHNMAAIKHLCGRALVFAGGRIQYDGPAARAVQVYLSKMDAVQLGRPACLSFRNLCPNPNLHFEVTGVDVLDQKGLVKENLHTWDYARFRITWRSAEFVQRGGVELGIYTLEGVPLMHYSTRPVHTQDVQFNPGPNQIEWELPQIPLAAGQYYISVALTRPMVEWLYRDDQFALVEVEPRDVFESGTPITASRSILVVPNQWLPTSGQKS